MKFFVGVSGFSYASWKGNFYPKDLKSEDFLSFYAGKLNSVEINSSFYAPPSAAMVKSWASRKIRTCAVPIATVFQTGFEKSRILPNTDSWCEEAGFRVSTRFLAERSDLSAAREA